jgi:hypothetical protein
MRRVLVLASGVVALVLLLARVAELAGPDGGIVAAQDVRRESSLTAALGEAGTAAESSGPAAQSPDPAPAASVGPEAAPAALPTTTAPAGPLARAPLAVPERDPFAPKVAREPVVAAPALPPPVAVAPPRPQAPPLPFKYLGRFSIDSNDSVLVVAGNRVLSVREGDVVEEAYRVERIGDTEIVLNYLPLEERQTLPLF